MDIGRNVFTLDEFKSFRDTQFPGGYQGVKQPVTRHRPCRKDVEVADGR